MFDHDDLRYIEFYIKRSWSNFWYNLSIWINGIPWYEVHQEKVDTLFTYLSTFTIAYLLSMFFWVIPLMMDHPAVAAYTAIVSIIGIANSVNVLEIIQNKKIREWDIAYEKEILEEDAAYLASLP